MKSGCPGQVEFSAVLGIQVTFRSHLPEGKLKGSGKLNLPGAGEI